MPGLKKILPLVLLAACLLTLSQSRVCAQVATTKDGHKVEIVLRPDKQLIMLDEPVFIAFEIKNLSSEDLCVWEGGDYRNRLGRPNSFEVTVTKDGGEAVLQPEASGSDGFGSCAQIKANGSHVLKLFLPHWATFETLGTYVVHVKKSLTIQLDSKWQHNHSMESSSYIKADVSTTIRVGPRDENGLVEIIDSFGAAMLDIGNAAARDSARALASIKDPRVIKYFAAALEAFGNSRAFGFSDDYPISLQAIYALSKFDDDSAIAALERAMNSPSEDIRENVATVLGSMKHPQAINLLRKMAQDENEDVRKAAQLALKERGNK